MKVLLAAALVVVILAAGMKLAGVPVPLLDYRIGPMGVDTAGPVMPNVQIEPPGFDDVEAP